MRPESGDAHVLAYAITGELLGSSTCFASASYMNHTLELLKINNIMVSKIMVDRILPSYGRGLIVWLAAGLY